MIFKIYGTDKNGKQDHLIIEEDSILEIQQAANEEVELRGWTDVYSQEIL